MSNFKERTEATEEAIASFTIKNGAHRAAIDALENRMEEVPLT